jgi:hypothetical protein
MSDEKKIIDPDVLVTIFFIKVQGSELLTDFVDGELLWNNINSLEFITLIQHMMLSSNMGDFKIRMKNHVKPLKWFLRCSEVKKTKNLKTIVETYLHFICHDDIQKTLLISIIENSEFLQNTSPDKLKHEFDLVEEGA